MNEKSKEFGVFLRNLRKLKGLTTRQFAENINVSHNYIIMIERGDCKSPSVKVVKSIAKQFNLDENVLLALAERLKVHVSDVSIKNLIKFNILMFKAKILSKRFMLHEPNKI